MLESPSKPLKTRIVV